MQDPENCILVAHCGYLGVVPKSFCTEWRLRPKVLAIVNDNATAIDARLPEGPVTLAKLHPKLDLMSVAEGCLESYAQYADSDCKNGGVIRVKDGPAFVRSLASHHYLITTGHNQSDIRMLGRHLRFCGGIALRRGNMSDAFAVVAKLGVVPVIAIEKASDAIALADALLEGGLQVAEVTFRTAAAAEALAVLKVFSAGAADRRRHLARSQLSERRRGGGRIRPRPRIRPRNRRRGQGSWSAVRSRRDDAERSQCSGQAGSAPRQVLSSRRRWGPTCAGGDRRALCAF